MQRGLDLSQGEVLADDGACDVRGPGCVPRGGYMRSVDGVVLESREMHCGNDLRGRTLLRLYERCLL